MKCCFRCNETEQTTELFEAVYNKGIVYICRKCYFKFRLPIIDKKEIDWDELNKQQNVRNRLSNMAKLRPDEVPERKVVINPEDIKLKQIVENNFIQNKIEKKDAPSELIDNFHWIVMRKRRALKITQKELAEKVLESEVVIGALEKGILPRDYVPLIKKVESILHISLFKEQEKQSEREIKPEDIVLESKVPTGVFVSELKKFLPKVFFRKKQEVVPEELDLKKVEELVGKPVEEKTESTPQLPKEEIKIIRKYVPEEKMEKVEDVIKLTKEGKPKEEKMEKVEDIIKSVKDEKKEESKPVEKKETLPKPEKIDFSNINELSQKDIDDLIWGKNN